MISMYNVYVLLLLINGKLFNNSSLYIISMRYKLHKLRDEIQYLYNTYNLCLLTVTYYLLII